MINTQMVRDVLICAASGNLTRLEIARKLNIKYDQVRYILRINKRYYIKKELRLGLNPKSCENCGNQTTNKRFCSHQCYNNYRIKTHINSPVKIRNSKSLKNHLLRRDGFLCSHCGNTHWLNYPINLRIFGHKNNLCLVCDNCYSFLKICEKNYRQESEAL